MKSSIPECSSKTLSSPSFSPSSFFGALFPLLLPLSWLIYVVAALCLSMRHHRKLVLTGFHHHLHHHHHHQHYHHHYSSLQSQRQPGPILSMFPCSIAVPDKVPEKGKIIWNLSDKWQSFRKTSADTRWRKWWEIEKTGEDQLDKDEEAFDHWC